MTVLLPMIFFGDKTDSASKILPTVQGNAAFPCGHSVFGFASTLLFAQLLPEKYQAFMLRGAEYGNSRVTLDVHYALDVIGARIMTTYILAQILNNNPDYLNQQINGLFGQQMQTTGDFQQLMLAAKEDLNGLLVRECQAKIAQCAAQDHTPTNQTNQTSAQERADYLWRLTYGLSPIGPTNLAPVVPIGAEALIAIRFPYLTAAQRREVLATTEIESGQALAQSDHRWISTQGLRADLT
ncbi:phosphatase PAP2 family protein [Utexia brackfieldae]|uniref:phosphatase PAP2 family protein n=1 Tax=Utexia brackfieldae TaxID=3074108 RepID=UPI00370DA379